MVELDEIIAKIKEKKELINLDNEYVRENVEKQLTPKIKKKIEHAKNIKQFFKSKEFDELRSNVRKQLRETYGMFQEERKLPDELTNVNVRKLLDTHQSTKERLPYYIKLYKDIFAITGSPEKVFDVGCGLNPVSYPFLGCTPHYVCSDISTADAEFLNEYFARANIDGIALAIDALKNEQVLAIEQEKPDVVFLFKLLNTLEHIGRHSTKTLFAAVADHASWIVVSFATVSLGGNKVIPPSKFSWFEKYLEKNDWTAEIIELPNEKFYVVEIK